MPSNTRSSRPTAQLTAVAIRPADPARRRKDPLPKAGAAKPVPVQPNLQQARKENRPTINSGEIIEISSDKDDEPVIPRAVATATSKLKERIRELEKENERVRKENAEIKKRQMVTADLEDQVTCEVCSCKMWSPFILPDCGHTFCQTDLENWFAAALKVHRNAYPYYNVNAPAVLNIYGQMQQQFPLPAYSCPKCREKVRSKPIQNFALKSLVRAVAEQSGETSPKKAVVVGGSNNAWNQFFPAR
ncbi:hypothetical protein C8R46DRAFT_301771 [Mycena filopes]|nr:hypothetical protein C8R46DRAFT_301771 [Mycena filopes]